jgi:DNA-binding MarR family transcriptional regulator
MLTTAEGQDLATGLRLAVTRTARRLRQEAGSGLSPSQTAALASIDRHGPLTPSDLATRERIKRPTATRTIDNLEAAGLVERGADPRDGRSCLVSATSTGRRVLAEQRERKDAYLARRLAGLTERDRTLLAGAVAVLERLLEEDPA